MAARSEAVRTGARRAARSRSEGDGRLHLGRPEVLIGLVCGALVVLGLVMILSASSVTSFANYGSSFTFFKRQVMWTAIGLAGFVFFARSDYRRLRGFGYVAFAAAALALAAVLVPGVGVVAGGSARWMNLGPLSFQPSEFAKLALILFAADVFSRKTEDSFYDLPHTLLPLIPALGVLAALVMLQPDLGTTLLIGAIGMGMLFVAGAPLRYMLPIGGLGAALAMAGALSAEYRRERLLAFLDPWRDPLNSGYQTIQSLIALGSGGWLGVGLGASRQKWMYIPNAHTDFIYAILGEEMGLLGTVTVLGLFAFLTYLGIHTARKAPDRFGMLLASGISIWIGFQSLVNMGAVTAALPITGVPLPLVSFGGTSLVVSLSAMGILTSIARPPAPRARRRGAAPTRRPARRRGR